MEKLVIFDWMIIFSIGLGSAGFLNKARSCALILRVEWKRHFPEVLCRRAFYSNDQSLNAGRKYKKNRNTAFT